MLLVWYDSSVCKHPFVVDLLSSFSISRPWNPANYFMSMFLFSDPVVLDGKKKLRYLKLPCCYLLTMQIYYRGDFGRLGHGNSSDLFTPQPIKALQGLKIKQIACGDSHCLAVTMDGEVKRSVTWALDWFYIKMICFISFKIILGWTFMLNLLD